VNAGLGNPSSSLREISISRRMKFFPSAAAILTSRSRRSCCAPPSPSRSPRPSPRYSRRLWGVPYKRVRTSQSGRAALMTEQTAR
jgi:hypothetical protein